MAAITITLNFTELLWVFGLLGSCVAILLMRRYSEINETKSKIYEMGEQNIVERTTETNSLGARVNND